MSDTNKLTIHDSYCCLQVLVFQRDMMSVAGISNIDIKLFYILTIFDCCLFSWVTSEAEISLFKGYCY